MEAATELNEQPDIALTKEKNQQHASFFTIIAKHGMENDHLGYHILRAMTFRVFYDNSRAAPPHNFFHNIQEFVQGLAQASNEHKERFCYIILEALSPYKQEQFIHEVLLLECENNDFIRGTSLGGKMALAARALSPYYLPCLPALLDLQSLIETQPKSFSDALTSGQDFDETLGGKVKDILISASQQVLRSTEEVPDLIKMIIKQIFEVHDDPTLARDRALGYFFVRLLVPVLHDRSTELFNTDTDTGKLMTKTILTVFSKYLQHAATSKQSSGKLDHLKAPLREAIKENHQKHSFVPFIESCAKAPNQEGKKESIADIEFNWSAFLPLEQEAYFRARYNTLRARYIRILEEAIRRPAEGDNEPRKLHQKALQSLKTTIDTQKNTAKLSAGRMYNPESSERLHASYIVSFLHHVYHHKPQSNETVTLFEQGFELCVDYSIYALHRICDSTQEPRANDEAAEAPKDGEDITEIEKDMCNSLVSKDIPIRQNISLYAQRISESNDKLKGFAFFVVLLMRAFRTRGDKNRRDCDQVLDQVYSELMKEYFIETPQHSSRLMHAFLSSQKESKSAELTSLYTLCARWLLRHHAKPEVVKGQVSLLEPYITQKVLTSEVDLEPIFMDFSDGVDLDSMASSALPKPGETPRYE